MHPLAAQLLGMKPQEPETPQPNRAERRAAEQARRRQQRRGQRAFNRKQKS